MANRKEVVLQSDERKKNGVTVLATRKGLEVNGWFDGFVGIGEPVAISWDAVDAARAKVNERTTKEV